MKVVILILATVLSFNLYSQKKYTDLEIKELWQKDSCGIGGDRNSIKNFVLFSKKFRRKSIDEIKYLLGKPIETDTLENGRVLVFYYLVNSLYFEDCSCCLKDLSLIGSLSIYFKKNRIIEIEYGME